MTPAGSMAGQGRLVPGVYLCRLEAAGRKGHRKLVILP